MAFKAIKVTSKNKEFIDFKNQQIVRTMFCVIARNGQADLLSV